MCSLKRALCRRHGDVQEEVIVLIDKANRLRKFRRILNCLHHIGNKSAKQKRCPRLVAVVHFVAHMQTLCNDVLDINAAGNFNSALNSGIQAGVKNGFHPLQTGDNFFAEGPHPQNLAESLIHIHIRFIAELLVLKNKDRHGWAGDARHGADGMVMMAGIKGDGTACGKGRGLLRRLSPPLVHARSHDSASHGAGHRLPRHRRTGVQQHFIPHSRDRILCNSHTHPRRLSLQQSRQSFLICRGNINTHHYSPPFLSLFNLAKRSEPAAEGFQST